MWMEGTTSSSADLGAGGSPSTPPAVSSTSAVGRLLKAFLRPEDVSCFLYEAVAVLADGRRKPCYLALVKHEPTPEYALLSLVKEDGDSGPYLRTAEVLPVYEDLRHTLRGETTMELSFGARSDGSLFAFQFQSADCALNVKAHLTKAIRLAQQDNFVFNGPSHAWTKPYISKESKSGEGSYTNRPYGMAKVNELQAAMQGLLSIDDERMRRDPSRESALGDLDEGGNPLVSFAKSRNGGEYDPSKFMSVKEVWVNQQMDQRSSEFTDYKPLRFMFGTWNVNGKMPESLDGWLRTDQPPPDLYAIGFQELDLSAQALVLGDTTRSHPWVEAIMLSLSKVADYHMLVTKQLVGILLVICVRQEHVPHIRSMQTAAASVGIMGIMGNKGGVAARFMFYDSSICILNSHLNAHYDRVQRRNQDYKDIISKLLVQNDLDIFDHDHVVWIGDLNYRIEGLDAVVRKKIREGDLAYLFERDQLRMQMARRLAFEEFNEGVINFAPTYKYDPGTDVYDSSEKKRTPAWCDRVMWRGRNMKQINYLRHELLASDHRPVSATFEIQVKSVNAEKRNSAYQEIVKKLDKLENECMPDATVSSNNVTFNNVRYMVPSEQTIELENTGKVVVRFRFIPKLNQKKFSKPWLDVRPPFGMVIPGEKMKIKLSVLINNSWAPDFNLGREKLEDILILHLEKGKDYFISISGSYIQSCFGSTLEHLVCFPGPVASSPAGPPTATDRLSIPKELWRIVDYIYRKGMDERGLFSQSGIQSEMEQLRELLDYGRSFDEYTGSIHSVAEILFRFLESLAEPIIPFALYKQALESSASYNQCKQLLSYLPVVNYNVFYYLMAFLREVLQHGDKNKLQADKLALLFSSVLVRSPNPRNVSEGSQEKKREFVYQFLSSKEKLKVP